MSLKANLPNDMKSAKRSHQTLIIHQIDPEFLLFYETGAVSEQEAEAH